MVSSVTARASSNNRTKPSSSSGRAELAEGLLDTHAWAWSLSGEERPSEVALRVIGSAHAVFVSPITFFEITQKVRLGKWPEMNASVAELLGRLERQEGLSAALEPAICLAGGMMD